METYYDTCIKNMLGDCMNWGSNRDALIETFKRGVDYHKSLPEDEQ